MFIFRDPFRLAGSESLDPVQAELERRILFAPPGPLGRIPTYEEVRAELADRADRSAASARALMLSEAGFGPGVRVVVVHDLDGGIDRIEPFGKAIPTPPQSADAEHFRPLGEAEISPQNVDCGRKDTTDEVLPNSEAIVFEIVEISDAAGSPSEGVISVSHIIVKSETPPQPQQKPQRARTFSKTNPTSLSETGLTPKPKAASKSRTESQAKAAARSKSRVKAAAKAKADRRPKRERKKTISPDERDEAELCFFMAEALGCPFNMKADLNPGHLDRLDVEGRIAFCMKIVGNLRAYIRSRRITRGMPESWWPDVWGWVRESDPWTNLKEHVHLVFYAPEDERRHMVKLMNDKCKDPEAKKWCENAKFARIHPWEHWTGSKFKSAFGYFVKMANPQDYHPDPTIWYKKSGFIAGPRIRFSRFLLDPDRVEAHRIDVQALEKRRDDDRAIMRRSGSEPAKNPRSLLRAAAASTPAPPDVRAEIVSDVPTAPAPVPAPVAVEPEPIEPDTCLTPGLDGPVHREDAERRDMDVVEIYPAEPAATEPALVLRGPAMTDAAPATAHAEAMELVEDVTPATPPSAPPVFVTEPATAIEAAIVPDVAADSAMPAPAGAPSASSSPKAVLASLAGLRRAVARTAAAGVGWVVSRLGARPPLAPTSAERLPRAPMFDPSAFAAAGAFFGAPDVRSDPW